MKQQTGYIFTLKIKNLPCCSRLKLGDAKVLSLKMGLSICHTDKEDDKPSIGYYEGRYNFENKMYYEGRHNFENKM